MRNAKYVMKNFVLNILKGLDENFCAERKFFVELEFATVQRDFKTRTFARAQLKIFYRAIHVVHDEPFAFTMKISVRRVKGQSDALRFVFRATQNKFVRVKCQFLDDRRFLHRVREFYRERQIFSCVDDCDR